MEEEILTEKDKKLKYLSDQYLRNIIRLKQNEDKLALKKKFFPPILFICFLITYIAFIAFIMEHIKNKLIQLISMIFLTVTNIYVYMLAYNFYNNVEYNERNQLIEEINSICKDLDAILEELGLNVEDYYKELEKEL